MLGLWIWTAFYGFGYPWFVVGRDVNLNLFNDKLVWKVFLPHPSSPARRGSTSPSAPSPQERAPTGKPAVLYSQTSSRPKGLLVVIDAIELRVFDARHAIVCAPRARLSRNKAIQRAVLHNDNPD